MALRPPGQTLLRPRHAGIVPDLLPSQALPVECGVCFNAKCPC